MDFQAWHDDVVGQEEARMISVEDWAEVPRLHFAEGLGIKTIARRLGLARNTVRAAVRSAEPPAYRRQGPGSRVDGVEAEIRDLLKEFPEMSATVISRRQGVKIQPTLTVRGCGQPKAQIARAAVSPGARGGPTARRPSGTDSVRVEDVWVSSLD